MSGASFLTEYSPYLPFVGLAASLVYYFLRVKRSNGGGKGTPVAPPAQNIVINQNNNVNSPSPVAASSEAAQLIAGAKKHRGAVNILFVDDDIKFKVVSILKNDGWKSAKIIRDITSLEQADVLSADIFFIDIQGVGKALHFKDQGLGLVVALKKKFPAKKVVIYSAESGLDAFHQAFKVADDQISKDADPYEFIDAVERLSP